jgi:hypothetical protein
VPFRCKNDAWWDLDGKAVRRRRLRKRITADLAFIMSAVALILTAALWIDHLGLMNLFPSA